MREDTCPHCGAAYQYLANHIEHCTLNPRVQAATRKALDDGTGTIRDRNEYAQDRRGGAPIPALWRELGTWPEVAKHFGLRMCADFEYRRKPSGLDLAVERIGAELDAEIARNRALGYECKAFRM